MLPKMPPRVGQVGFLFVPPFRIQGVSIAGEQTMIQVPELDVAFDIGLCPRVALGSPFVALSHGHMDHVGGLPYYFSQRMFQRMGVGTCLCHSAIADSLNEMMLGWVALENQQTQYAIVGLDPDQDYKIKNNIMLRAIEVSHTVAAMGYALIEHRSKLRDEYREMPQEQLRELKRGGTEITKTLHIPLIAYTGDTELGPYLFRDEFVNAQVVVSECTFFDDDHRSRAKVGKHLHVEDIAALMQVWRAKTIVLVHLTRRTNIASAREQLVRLVGEEEAHRVVFLMDHRANRERYERQRLLVEAGESIAI